MNILPVKNITLLPFYQSQILHQTKFRYPLLGKTFKKQRKTIEDQENKQGGSSKGLKTA